MAASLIILKVKHLNFYSFFMISLLVQLQINTCHCLDLGAFGTYQRTRSFSKEEMQNSNQMVLKVVLGCVYFNTMLWNRGTGFFLKLLFQRNTFYVKALLFT